MKSKALLGCQTAACIARTVGGGIKVLVMRSIYLFKTFTSRLSTLQEFKADDSGWVNEYKGVCCKSALKKEVIEAGQCETLVKHKCDKTLFLYQYVSSTRKKNRKWSMGYDADCNAFLKTVTHIKNNQCLPRLKKEQEEIKMRSCRERIV